MFAWRRTATRRRVLVNLKTEKALGGVLWAKRGPILVLKDATLIEPHQAPLRVDGEILIERSNVDFMQVLPPPPPPPPLAEA